MILRKNLPATVTLAALLLLTPLLLPKPVSSISGPGPPDVYMVMTPKALPVAAGCPATFTVQLVSQEGFLGAVTLTMVSAPSGVNVAFNPNPVFVREYSEVRSTLTVTVSPDTPQGVTSLSLKATSADRKISHTTAVTLNIGPPCTQQQNGNTTTTVTSSNSSNSITTITSEITLTRTITEIRTSTSTTTLLTTFTTAATAAPLGQGAEPFTSAWAVGATVVTLALAEVLLLKRAK
ncbi:MAG: hypothetical protein M1503_00785 [Thaumarchaeota archaeon]|nr:hypothetical protein [Nitrososphaerota archaeon]MCL5316789.1 hypothetical protein [Nitrososphaerota archaeon]